MALPFAEKRSLDEGAYAWIDQLIHVVIKFMVSSVVNVDEFFRSPAKMELDLAFGNREDFESTYPIE